MSLLIKNGTVTDPANGILGRKLDLLIDGGIVKRLAEGIAPGPSDEVYDAEGCVVAPGFIDIHTHMREPGREDEERVHSGTRAAAMGGFTSIAAMPNTTPVTDSVVGVKFVQMLAEKEGVVNVYPVAAITKKQEGEELTEIGDLVDEGAVAVSDDGTCVMNAELMRRALEYARMFKVTVIQHAEDRNLAEGGMMHEGAVSLRIGLKGIPSIAEETIVSRDILLAEYTSGRLHIAHASTRGTIELVRGAKKKGLAVTCEVTGHHFSLTDDLLEGFDANYKMNPPLRSREDVDAIVAGLKDGTVDCIVSDHAPHTIFEKEQEFDYAPFGIIGLETLVPLAFTHLVKPGKLTVPQVVEKFTNGYKVLNIPFAGLKEGAKADVTVVDPSLEFEYKLESIVSKSRNSPFIGTRFTGAPVLTVVAGRVIMKDRKLTV
jgi:dihydroorotase